MPTLKERTDKILAEKTERVIGLVDVAFVLDFFSDMTAKDIQKTVVEKGDNAYEIRYGAPKFTNETLATISVTENENGEFTLTDISISDSDYIDSVLGVSVNDGISTIKEAAYNGPELVEVAIAESVTKIEDGAFGCDIEVVTLRYGDSNKSIGFEAFGENGPKRLDATGLSLADVAVCIIESNNDTRNFQNVENMTINNVTAKFVGRYPDCDITFQDDKPEVGNDEHEIEDDKHEVGDDNGAR